MLGYLESIYARFGYVRNELRTVVMPGIEGKQDMARMLESLRGSPPAEVAGLPVTELEDLLDEEGRLGPLEGETDRASRNFLILRFGDRARLALRPSGTEPKAKCYLEASSPPRPTGMSDADWRRLCAETDALVMRLGDEFLALAQARRG